MLHPWCWPKASRRQGWGAPSPSLLPFSADSLWLRFVSCSMTNTSEKYERTQQGNLLLLPHPPPNLFSPSPNPSFPPSPTPQSKNQFSIFTFPQPNSEDHPLLELYNKCANIHGEAHQEQVGRWSLDENKRKTVDLWWSIIAWRTPFCADKISSEMGSTGLCHNSYLIWQFCKIMKIFHLIGDRDKL